MLENNQPPTTPILVKDLGRLYPTETSKHKTRYGTYLCECGTEFRAQTANVKNGRTRSCGCYSQQQIIKRNTSHGLTGHRLYNIWSNIVQRTSNPTATGFEGYGARGITVCDEWRNDFKKFYDDMIGIYQEGLQIDRINNDGNYEPSNCRFVTRTVNSRNTRKLKTNNTSGYRGVSFHKRDKKWVVNIVINNKQKYLGYFSTALEAAAAYDRFVIENNLEHTKNGVYYAQN